MKIKLTKDQCMKIINNPLFKLLWYSFFLAIGFVVISTAKVQPLQPDKVVQIAVDSFREITQESLFPEFKAIRDTLEKDIKRKNLDKQDFIEKQSGKIFDLLNNGVDDLKWGDIKTARRYRDELTEDKQEKILTQIDPYMKDIDTFFKKNKHLH